MLALVVSGGRQPAPSAKSIRPSPSMSWGWMQTLSFSVPPRMMSCRFQVGFSYQIDGIFSDGHDVELAVAIDIRDRHRIADVADMSDRSPGQRTAEAGPERSRP